MVAGRPATADERKNASYELGGPRGERGLSGMDDRETTLGAVAADVDSTGLVLPSRGRGSPGIEVDTPTHPWEPEAWTALRSVVSD
jgi:hypothetical protein